MHLTRLALARNFFDVVSKLPRAGVGERITRKTWGEDSYWTVKRVQLALDGRHGKAHGVLTWRGETADRPTRINGTLKSVWRRHGAQPLLAWKSLEKPALQQSPGEAPAEGAQEA